MTACGDSASTGMRHKPQDDLGKHHSETIMLSQPLVLTTCMVMLHACFVLLG